MDLFVAGSLDRLIPEDHVLMRVGPRTGFELASGGGGGLLIARTMVDRGSTRRWRCA